MRGSLRGRSFACALFACILLPGTHFASQSNPAQAGKVSQPGQYAGYSQPIYDGVERTSFYVPVRDGTRLAVDLFRPTQNGVVASEKLPVIWMHTPYNRRTYRGGPTVERYPGFAARLIPYGYNVAIVDYRGVYASFGTNAAYTRGEWLDPARMDAYDITEWLAKQPYSNGKIGMWGCSATGTSQLQAATTRPPSLKAIFPISVEFDALPFGGMVGPLPVNAGASNRDRNAVPVDGPDGAALLARAVAEHRGNVETFGSVPFRDSVSEALNVAWWTKSSPATYLKELQASGIGIYATANWNEAGSRQGAFYLFGNVPNTKMVVGPAGHCAWTEVKSQTGFDIVTEELRFFDYWLKGIGNGVMSEPGVTYFTYNAPQDSAWRRSKTWPLKNEVRTDYYLGADTLTQNKPIGAGRDPVAMGEAARTTSTGVEVPAGGIAYETEPLSKDVEITGHPVMRLWLATDAGDVDAVAKLEDVAPDGTATSYYMVGQLRASHRALAKAPYDTFGLPWHTHRERDVVPVPKGEPVELAFDFLPMSYIFKAGHRIRLRLTFSDPAGQPAQTVVVLREPKHASMITLPIIPER